MTRLLTKFRLALLISCSVALGTPAMTQAAQDDGGWDFVLAPYVLFPHMSGNVTVGGSPSEVDVGPGDVFENLDFGAMLHLEMANPNWAITFDGYYVDLGAAADIPESGQTANVDIKQWMLEAAGLWSAAEWAEVGIGARLNSIEGSLLAEALGPAPEIDESGKHTWVDPVIVARLTAPLENRWRLGVRGDIGGFGIGSSFTWQIRPFVGYRFANLFELVLSYRALGMDYETGSGAELFVYDVTTFGPELGFVFHF
jgi:hypothetical protein